VKIYINVEKLLSWKYDEEDESYNDFTFDQLMEMINYRNSLTKLLNKTDDPYLQQIIIEDIEWMNNKIHAPIKSSK
jgi:hypothetical protein